ncbi:MAG TPA: efflux RND transporter permease subunit, partial [Kofleriaceae bacterium]|nr:efflux RND transporter permease subunit [Kofleriaceae bacterium]
AIGLLALLSAFPLARSLGSEFMPPLNEGDILYMPITGIPGISIEEAKRQLQAQDRALRQFPEVASVFGKIGRAETPTDPAPLTMVETTVRLRPASEWRKVREERWYSAWAPGFLQDALGAVWPEERPMSWDELTAEMNAKMQFPGWTNAWTMPIKTRVDMLTTGIRTPIGIKVFGTDLAEIEKIGITLERLMSPIDGTRSVLYERSQGGLYLDITPDRDRLARYGLTVGDVERTIEAAIGGIPVTVTIEKRNRFTVNVRYPQDLRSDMDSLRRVLVPVPAGMQQGGERLSVPLGELADIEIAGGPPMVRDEDGLLVGYVYVDIDQGRRDIGGYVNQAKEVVRRAQEAGQLTLPAGYFLKWTGQYELLEEMSARMRIVVPMTLLIVIVLLFLQFKNLVEVFIILLSVPFALVGSAWLMWLLDYRVSTAVWVGVIALVGLAAQTGIVMIVYIDNAYAERRRAGRIRDLDDIIAAHMEGTVMRVRPKLMTVATMLIGLVPLLWAQGSGADVMKRLAAPMVGGLITSAFLTLEIIPVISTYWRQEQLLLERLQPLDARRWRVMSAAVLAIKASWIAALAAGLLLVMFDQPALAPWLTGTAILAGLVQLGAIAFYLVKRPAARRTVWPPQLGEDRASRTPPAGPGGSAPST